MTLNRRPIEASVVANSSYFCQGGIYTPGLLATDIHIQILIFLTRELSEPL